MVYTQSIGNINELYCMIKFIELGYECSVPYGNGAKYDFIADVNGKLLRIQCKSSSRVKSSAKGKEYDDAFSFYTVAQTTNTQRTIRHTYNKNQIDYFATCFEGKVYLVPVEECSTSKTLRFSPPANNNKNYNRAEDYEIEKVLGKAQELLESEDIYLKNKISTQQKQEYYCSQCGTQITKYSSSGLCSTCKAKSTRRVERPSREELKI